MKMLRVRKFQVLILTCCLVTLPALAEPVLKNDYFELVLEPQTKILERFDNGWETRMTVEKDGQRIRVNWKRDRALLLFPTATMRFRSEATSTGTALKINLDADKYEVDVSPREVAWLLPERRIYFQTRGGKVSQAVGSEDYLKLHRDTRGGRVTLESKAGVTDALIDGKGHLETFDGPDVSEHLYMVKGLAFKQGPITVRVPLPRGPFLDALPENRYLTVEKELVAPPTPAAAAPPEETVDPLQAEPATWDSPELRARFNDPSEDPISVKKERRVKYDEDPLKAKTQADSEELLRVKNY